MIYFKAYSLIKAFWKIWEATLWLLVQGMILTGGETDCGKHMSEELRFNGYNTPGAPNSQKWVIFKYFRPQSRCYLHTWSLRVRVPFFVVQSIVWVPA